MGSFRYRSKTDYDKSEARKASPSSILALRSSQPRDQVTRQSVAILVDASRDSSVVERDLGTVEGDKARS